MFKFSALSQIWKKYILKLNAWDLSLNITNFSFLGSIIPSFLADGAYMLQFMTNQGVFPLSLFFFGGGRINSHDRKSYGNKGILQYEVSLSKMLHNIL